MPSPVRLDRLGLCQRGRSLRRVTRLLERDRGPPELGGCRGLTGVAGVGLSQLLPRLHGGVGVVDLPLNVRGNAARRPAVAGPAAAAAQPGDVVA